MAVTHKRTESFEILSDRLKVYEICTQAIISAHIQSNVHVGSSFVELIGLCSWKVGLSSRFFFVLRLLSPEPLPNDKIFLEPHNILVVLPISIDWKKIMMIKLQRMSVTL
jgi:hypothetical protein